jgi:hypothetical protein
MPRNLGKLPEFVPGNYPAIADELTEPARPTELPHPV